MAAHDASLHNRRLRVVWDDIPELEPRVEERPVRSSTTQARLDALVERLKASGASSVEILR